MINKNSWVQIKRIILKPNERALHLPTPTKQVPLVMWIKGHLLEDALIGSKVDIKTLTGRLESGILICENPSYLHTYGKFIPEIMEIDRICKNTLFGSDDDE